MRLFSRLLVLVLVLGTFCTRSHATLISYVGSINAVGTLGDQSFIGPVTIFATADTNSIVYEPTNNTYHLLSNDAVIEVAGLGSAAFTDTIQIFSAPNANTAGFADSSFNIIFSTIAPSLSSYDLSTAIGPVAGQSAFTTPFQIFPTTGGNLVLSGLENNGSGDPTFAAYVTPEPSTLLLLSTGSVGIIGLVRRKFLTRI